MKRTVAFLLFILALNAANGFGQGTTRSSDKMWREIDDATLQQRQLQRSIIPNHYRTFTLNRTALKNTLRNAPVEFTDAARNNPTIMTLPMPDGKFARFAVQESPIMEPELALKHPDIKTYTGQGIDDPTATARFSSSPQGFSSMILSAAGTVQVDRYAVGDTGNYISYFKSDVERTGEFVCHFRNDVEEFTRLPELLPEATNVVSGTNLRTYRLALAATGEYTSVFRQMSDTDAQARARALEQIILIMNRVNGVFEREVAIRMVLIAAQDSIIYTDGTTDPYTNQDGVAMLTENLNNLSTVIGNANFDIGHVFSTGGGGIAQLRSPCGSGKARGVTGLPNPFGDPFAIDFVAHEIGHQFGGNHTFNGVGGGCSGNTASNAAYEPGSGVTIMGYAGICGSQNLASNSIDTFHVKSIEEMVSFSTGTGNACAISTATGNTPPTVTTDTGLTIPKLTPFTLNASATDPDNDSLTYDWQEYDLGAPATTAAGNSDADGMERPLFRPFPPTTGGARTFPRLLFILNNANVPPPTTGGRLTGEVLPSISRTMLFQVIVRDNRTGGGGIRSRFGIIVIDGNSGPFAITAPETAVTWATNTPQTVTWNVANTDTGAVNAANVKISLSTDGGNTFPIVLAESTPNDGTETITVPSLGLGTNQARIKVQAVGNIFFDISGVNFNIISFVPTIRSQFDYDGDGKADVSVFRQSNGTWYLQQSTAGFSGLAFGLSTDKLAPADYDGDGKTDVGVVRDGIWYLQRSQLGFTGIAFGDSSDVPVPADYDGDGKADVAVFRPSNGTWYIQRSQLGFTGIAFGQNGDKPVAADYDGDGKTDVAVNRMGTWFILRSQLGFTGIAFGDANDKLVPADYDGDGKADVAVFRPSNGAWYIQRSQLGFTGITFGLGTDIPTAADYDGDGKADLAVFRSGIWYLNRTTQGFTGVTFGAATDLPTPNVYVR